MTGPTFIVARIHTWMQEDNPEFMERINAFVADGYQVKELAPDINGVIDYCITFDSDDDAVVFRLKYS